MANKVSPSAFIKTALHNGVGRYVCQLQRLTLKFCKGHGGSNGLREFIEKDLMDFVKTNPGIVVYLKPRVIGPPSVTAEYLNGQTHYVSFPKKGRDEIVKWMEYMRTRSGFPIARYIKTQHTDTPSIQGVWTPYLNKPAWLNAADFPNEKRAEIKTFFPTATEQLLELSKHFGTEEEKEEKDDHVEKVEQRKSSSSSAS